MRSPSSTLLTPIRHRCSHTLLSIMFKVYCFVLVDKQIIYDYVPVISGFEEQLVLSNLTACCNSVVYLFHLQCLLFTAVCWRDRMILNSVDTGNLCAHQLGRQSLQCSWTSSLELFADRRQTAGLVI